MMRFSYLFFFVLLIGTPSAFAQITNDFCESALFIPDPTEYCSETGEYSNIDATESGVPSPSCFPNGEEDNDVWFSFVAQANGLNVQVIGDTDLNSGGTLLSPEVALYSGDCSNLLEVECISDAFGSNVAATFAGPLIAGATYFLRVNARDGNTGTFKLCLINFNLVPEPDGDCPTGVILCEKTTFTVDKVLGEGNNPNEMIPSACNGSGAFNTCIMDERSSTWYKWTCEQSGTLAFDITPLNPDDDLDFVVYELPNGVDDCSQKIELRCMLSGENVGDPEPEWAPCTGATGLSLSDTDTGETCGCQPGDNNYVQAIQMEAGKAYTLAINNFSQSGNGFSINFGGTGTFAGPVADFDIDPPSIECDLTVEITDFSSYINGTIRSKTWFFGEGAVPPTGSGDGPFTVAYPSIGTKLIVLTLETEEGCLVTEIRELEVLSCCDLDSNINLSLVDFTDPTCSYLDDGTISVTGTGGDPDYSYSINGGPYQSSPNFVNLSDGTFTIDIIDIKGCEDRIDVPLTDPPPLVVDAGPDQTVDLGFSTSISATVSPSGSNVNVQWTPDTLLSCSTCLDLTLTPPGQTEYTITVIDEDGCQAEDQIVLRVRDVRPVYIPTAFSPNADGINDFLGVFAGPATTEVVRMDIYDRWGELLWRKDNFPINAEVEGWDGKFRGEPMPQGIYVYYAIMGFIDGKEIIYEGDVTLLR